MCAGGKGVFSFQFLVFSEERNPRADTKAGLGQTSFVGEEAIVPRSLHCEPARGAGSPVGMTA